MSAAYLCPLDELEAEVEVRVTPSQEGWSSHFAGACAIRDGVGELGLEIRAGLHTGECELVDDKVGGIAVHIGARVASVALPGEVLVSRTVRDLVAGSGIGLDDRGRHALEGIAGEWQLYAVTTAAEPNF